jgi:hypothetical protein
MSKQTVAYWSSKRGKYWLELIAHGAEWSYKCESGGGYLGAITREDAFNAMRAHLDGYAMDEINMVRR